MNKEKIIKIVKEALNQLYLHDKSIIDRAVREEEINSRLAMYLEKILHQENYLYYNADTEHDKNYDIPKRAIINGKETDIRPDIIVHVRGPNKDNLIAFECKKKYNTKEHKKDFDKIEALLNKPYNYKFGCLIEYLPSKPSFKIELFNGNINNKEEIPLEKLQSGDT